MKISGIKSVYANIGQLSNWYRTIPNIDTHIIEIGIPDEEELWGWGTFRKFALNPVDQCRNDFSRLLDELEATNTPIDSVIICGACKWDDDQLFGLVEELIQGRRCLLNSALEAIQGYDCVNVLKAIDLARTKIDQGDENILILAADCVENDQYRFRRFCLFSDFTLGLVISNDIEACAYQLINTHTEADPNPITGTNEITSRNLDAEVINALLLDSGIKSDSVDKLFYINLYEPIVNMRGNEFGVGASSIYIESIRSNGHCFGADPIINLLNYCSSEPFKQDDLFLLAASSKTHVGGVVIKPLCRVIS
jgi:3-oxoacyl-[acyl-carrier-protein] synthase III